MARIIPSRYTTAIVIFIVIVFIVLTIASIRMFGQSPIPLQRFPPWISECPPYWTNEGNGQCSYNTNQPNGKPACTHNDLKHTSTSVQGMAYENGSPVDFSSAGLNERCTWAKKCQVYWDGISDQNCNNSSHFDKYSLN